MAAVAPPPVPRFGHTGGQEPCSLAVATRVPTPPHRAAECMHVITCLPFSWQCHVYAVLTCMSDMISLHVLEVVADGGGDSRYKAAGTSMCLLMHMLQTDSEAATSCLENHTLLEVM